MDRETGRSKGFGFVEMKTDKRPRPQSLPWMAKTPEVGHSPLTRLDSERNDLNVAVQTGFRGPVGVLLSGHPALLAW